PANIITAWEMGRKYDPGIFIWETSLGGTGLAMVGVLTNIAEDYPISAGLKTASQVKAQIFQSKLVVCDFDSYRKFYIQYKEKTNTVGLTEGNVKARSIIYGLTETFFNVEVQGLKTISGEILDDSFQVKTFAPAPYHVENVLSAVCASLTCGKSFESIKSGLKNFHGLKGRTSLKVEDDTVVIEEINPGINVTAVERAVGMIKHLPQSVVIFGGKYGVTCEKIDEKSVSLVLNEIDSDIGLVLTDELGASVEDRVKRDLKYVEDFPKAVEHAKKHYQNILLIYRSNFPDINHR
ncbi:MAG TPA: coenzyme F430 synthase, partial [Methanobacterium sp.]